LPKVVNDKTIPNLSWEIYIERTCSRISRNLFIINRLSKILDLTERKTLYYGLIYPLVSYGIAVWGHSAKANTTRIFALQKRALRYTAGLKHFESCRNSIRNLNILTIYSLYIQETILYVKKKKRVTAQ
jgi:hypothetical protein